MFDGDGTGDDRRINLLQKVLSSWVPSENSAEKDNLVMLNKSLSLLRAIECSWMKSDLMKKCYQKEVEFYKYFQERTQEFIENIKETIDASKTILQDVQQEKQQKLTYNMISEEIDSVLSRQETTNIVNNLSEKILDLNKENSRLSTDWIRWRQHFKVISTSSNELWQMLEKYKEN